jgi:hypothetical protein
MVIDNLFTPEDCARYLAAAEASKDWDVAAINGGDSQVRYHLLCLMSLTDAE